MATKLQLDRDPGLLLEVLDRVSKTLGIALCPPCMVVCRVRETIAGRRPPPAIRERTQLGGVRFEHQTGARLRMHSCLEAALYVYWLAFQALVECWGLRGIPIDGYVVETVAAPSGLSVVFLCNVPTRVASGSVTSDLSDWAIVFLYVYCRTCPSSKRLLSTRRMKLRSSAPGSDLRREVLRVLSYSARKPSRPASVPSPATKAGPGFPEALRGPGSRRHPEQGSKW